MRIASRPCGSRESFGRPQHGADVRQVLALHTTLDGFEHQRLDVFGVDEAVLVDASGRGAA